VFVILAAKINKKLLKKIFILQPDKKNLTIATPLSLNIEGTHWKCVPVWSYMVSNKNLTK